MIKSRWMSLQLLVRILLTAAGVSAVALAAGFHQPSSVDEATELEEPATRVLDRFIEAIGGEEVIRQHSSRRLRGQIIVRQRNGNEFKGTLVIEQQGNKIRQETVFPGRSEEVRVFDGELGWTVLNTEEPKLLEGDELARLRRAADFFYWYGLDYRERYVTLQSLGVQQVQRKNYEYLIGKRTDGHFDTLLFDPNDGLLRCVAAVPKDGDPNVETEYNWIDEYVEINGVMVPAKFRRLAPQYNLDVDYRKIEFDVDLGNSFDRPDSL